MPFKDPNDLIQHNKNYYIKNKENIKARARSKYSLNPEPFKTKTKIHRTKNHSKILEIERHRRVLHPESKLLYHAKERAKKNNLDFNLEKEDIKIPDICPVLGISLKVNEGKLGPDSPTIDRIDNSKGYTKENILVVSHKANTIKNNATIDELFKVARFYEQFKTLSIQ